MINIEKAVTRDNLEIGKKYYCKFFDDSGLIKSNIDCFLH